VCPGISLLPRALYCKIGHFGPDLKGALVLLLTPLDTLATG
jgi:hypothetical protein